MNRIIRIAASLLVVLAVVYGGWLAFKWGVMRVYVPPDSVLIITSKFGQEMPPDWIAVPREHEGSYKGVYADARGPGRYFLNPLFYEWELSPMTVIHAGDPQRWSWDSHGRMRDANTAPQIGLVAAREGREPPVGMQVVPAGYKGIQQQILTPGIYRINPKMFEVTAQPSVMVPPGSVAVLTQLSDRPTAEGQVAGQILPDVLQPGIYYLNPRMYKVDVVPVGYDQITLEAPQNAIRLISQDGYVIEADLTVIWGRTPTDAPAIIRTIGDIERVERYVIEPTMSSVFRNVGARYTARQMIEGETRIQFQNDLTQGLQEQVQGRNVQILLALVRHINIRDTGSTEQQRGRLIETIQRASIEEAREETNRQRTITAAKRTELEQWLREVDIARERIAAETGILVQTTRAEGEKNAAQTEAQREREVAAIRFELAQVEARRIRELGQAAADVERMKREADARGAQLMIEAFGSPLAYNQYIFAQRFEPRDIRLIFAGPGTFWTDLRRFEEIGATQLIQQGQEMRAPVGPAVPGLPAPAAPAAPPAPGPAR